MLKQFYIFCFLIGMTHLSQAQHVQLIENRGELGLFGGQSSYRGDIAPDVLKWDNSLGFFYKQQYNDYAGLRVNYELIQLGANDMFSYNPYAYSRGFTFSRKFHDISVMSEFYFTRFLPGNKRYRFTPYLGIGAGYSLEIGNGKKNVSTAAYGNELDSISLPPVSTSKGYFNFPLQIGFKYNISQRWNIFGEAMYRFMNTDELDFIADGALIIQTQKVASVPVDARPIVLKYQGSRSGSDQFFSIKGGISYNLFNIYGASTSKPGKKSKSASRKANENRPKKTGFSSRFKFKRK